MLWLYKLVVGDGDGEGYTHMEPFHVPPELVHEAEGSVVGTGVYVVVVELMQALAAESQYWPDGQEVVIVVGVVIQLFVAESQYWPDAQVGGGV